MLVNEKYLKKWLVCSQQTKIVRFLIKNDIPHWIERGHVLTTTEAINNSLLKDSQQLEAEIEFNNG